MFAAYSPRILLWPRAHEVLSILAFGFRYKRGLTKKRMMISSHINRINQSLNFLTYNIRCQINYAFLLYYHPCKLKVFLDSQ